MRRAEGSAAKLTEAARDDAKDCTIAVRLAEARSPLDGAKDWTLAANHRASSLPSLTPKLSGLRSRSVKT
jgi:hypothetical protein